MFHVSNKRKFDIYNISSAITVDYTGFDAFPASSPGNFPILMNGVDSTWRQALSEILANKAENAGNNNEWQRLHNEWKLEDVAKKWTEILWTDYQRQIDENSEEYNKVFAVWLVHDIPVLYSNTIDTKIIDFFESAFRKGLIRESKPLEYDWLAEAKNLMAQPNQTLYNVYNVLWNHADIEIKKYFRSDISQDW